MVLRTGSGTPRFTAMSRVLVYGFMTDQTFILVHKRHYFNANISVKVVMNDQNVSA